MAIIAVAGGLGQVGRALVDGLVQHGHKVLVLTRKASESSNTFTIVTADYDDVDATTRLLQDNKVDTLMCAIGVINERSNRSQLNLIKAAAQSACTHRFVIGSYDMKHLREHVDFSPLAKYTFEAVDALEKPSEKEIDELVEDWTPEPLLQPLNEEEQQELASVPVILGPGAGPRPMLSTGQTVLNLTSFNFAGLANLQETKDRCIEILRAYGLGSCGPPGFYGSIDVAVQLERDIANFLNVESSIIYSQAFAMSSSIIPAFCKMGDVIVADAGVNFGIRKGLQNSRSTVRFYRHNDMQALEELLLQLERERRKKKLPLTRRFIVTEGLFENDGVIADLPKLIELKKKFKYRLYLDENFSFGVLGAHGRGLTEHYGIEAKEVDILCGSLGHSISACGGFCAGTRVMVEHQRINSSSVVFSAAMPPLLSVAGSESIKRLAASTAPLEKLNINLRAAQDVLLQTRGIKFPSDRRSPVIHLYIASSAAAAEKQGLLTVPEPTYFSGKPSSSEAARFAAEEKILQRIVDRALAQGVMITRARRLKGQENPEPRPSIRLTISAAMTLEDVQQSCRIVKGCAETVLGEEGLL